MRAKLPFGQVPVLRTPTGAEIAQSSAILRFVGRSAPGDLLYPQDLEVR